MEGPLDMDQLQQLFLFYCNEGRTEKVVHGLTDTMYKRRFSSAGGPRTITKGGFRKMFTSCSGLVDGPEMDLDVIFAQNVGMSDEAKPKFELSFPHYLDALATISVRKYPVMDPETAVRTVVKRFLRPLYVQTFGDPGATDCAPEEFGEGAVEKFAALGLGAQGSVRAKPAARTGFARLAAARNSIDVTKMRPLPGGGIKLDPPRNAQYSIDPFSLEAHGISEHESVNTEELHKALAALADGKHGLPPDTMESAAALVSKLVATVEALQKEVITLRKQNTALKAALAAS